MLQSSLAHFMLFDFIELRQFMHCILTRVNSLVVYKKSAKALILCLNERELFLENLEADKKPRNQFKFPKNSPKTSPINQNHTPFQKTLQSFYYSKTRLPKDFYKFHKKYPCWESAF